MNDSTLSVRNQTRDTHVCNGLLILDAEQASLEMFIDGVAQIAKASLWLKPFHGVPEAPGLASVEALLLDANLQVLACIPELPGKGLDAADPRVATALIVPAFTIARAQIQTGDQIGISDAETKVEHETGDRAGSEEGGSSPAELEPEHSGTRMVQVQAAIQDLKASEERAANASGAPPSKSFGKRLAGWMTGEGARRERAKRNRFPRLVAYYWNGGSPKALRVGDVGSTGFYLITEDRWSPGTQILMTLQHTEGDAESPENSVTVPARVVRAGPDGVGFEFVASAAVDPGSLRMVPSTRHSRDRLAHFLAKVTREG